MTQFLSNFLHFLAYFGVSLALLVVFKYVYVLVTPHDEWKLIKEEKNTAAALGFGGAIAGFALALSGVVSHSVSLVDCTIWGVVALGAQAVAFLLVRLLFLPKIVTRITEGEVSAGVILAAVNVAIGLLNAACMTY